MKENIKFILKVTFAHIGTYIICGMFFSYIFNYEEFWQSGIFGSYMRDYSSPIIAYGGMAVQLIRGLLFGLILLLIPREFFLKKLAWLKLWIIVAGIGIINIPGPWLGSIEGIIYTVTPFHYYRFTIEIFVQTLLFSILVCMKESTKLNVFFKKFKHPIIAFFISIMGISLSGILIASLKEGVDPMEGAGDPFAMLILLVSGIIAFFITLWYTRKRGKRTFIFLPVYYISCGPLAVIYNYATNGPFQSLIPLGTALVLTLLTWLLVRK